MLLVVVYSFSNTIYYFSKAVVIYFHMGGVTANTLYLPVLKMVLNLFVVFSALICTPS